MKVSISQPNLGQQEQDAVLQVLSSGRLSSGQWTRRLEEDFTNLSGARDAVACSSGTAALMMALRAHEIGPGDEVIVPSFSFFATASAVLSVGAVPVFADVRPDTFTLDPEAAALLISEKTRAVLPVHLFGHPAQMLQLESLCRQNGLHLIQDAAQAHLAMLGSRPLGSFGTACFSFFASKNMTTGEGGMVVTTDEKVGRRLRMLVNHGRNECGEFEMLGFNFRMSEMCAALGVVQLEKLPELTRKRIENAAYYDAAITQLSTPVVLPNAHHVYHQYTLLVPRDLDRDRIVSSLHRAGIEARIYYQNAIHQLPAVQKYPRRQGSLLVTEDLTHRVLSIPVHPEVTAEQRAFVVESLQRACSDDAD